MVWVEYDGCYCDWIGKWVVFCFVYVCDVVWCDCC